MAKSIDQFPYIESLDVLQGGMGAAVSDDVLAGEVASQNATGIVSGTAIGTVLARRLQDGDPSGEIRDALANYPVPEIAEKIVKMYHKSPGRSPGERYKSTPMFDLNPSKVAADLAVLGAFVEVFLAKRRANGRGHIGINLLTKVEEPNLHTLYGAMQAGVDIAAMGAGLPTMFPEYINRLSDSEPVDMPVHVLKATREWSVHLDPRDYGAEHHEVSTPRMLAIVTSDVLARRPLAQAKVPPDGFIIEEPVAGGHNAPPRGSELDERGQPIYTERDYANLNKMVDIGLPFWLAGGYGSPEGLQRALALGAVGVQVGSLFALTRESGMREDIKKRMIEEILSGRDIDVFTDRLASPTGFPFKVAKLDGTLSDAEVYNARERICDLGALRERVEVVRYNKRTRQDEPAVIYRCPSEPEADFVKKGGLPFRQLGRMCLCNGLVAEVGMGQVRDWGEEPAVTTIGDDVNNVVRAVGLPLTARRVVRYIRGQDDPDESRTW